MSLFTDTLLRRLEQNGIALSPAQAAQCEGYYRRMVDANSQLNLTRITEQSQAAEQHFADAMRLCALCVLPKNCSVIDIGTGAGFPGVPLLILRPDIRLTLLDASGKKTDFVRTALTGMGLCADVVCGRAEELARTGKRGSFDVAVSRAVAPLRMLLELSMPLVKPGGMLAAWKGEKYAQEIDEAQSALDTLGCAITGCHPAGQGALLIIRKQKPTPDIYPRRFSRIKSQPL